MAQKQRASVSVETQAVALVIDGIRMRRFENAASDYRHLSNLDAIILGAGYMSTQPHSGARNN